MGKYKFTKKRQASLKKAQKKWKSMPTHARKMRMPNRRLGYGVKDGSRSGMKLGGRGRNQTSTCRHPSIRRGR